MRYLKPNMKEYNERMKNNLKMDILLKKASQSKDEQIRIQDARYTTIVSVILREIQKRDINYDDSEFDIKIDQIIEMLQQNPFFKRFREDSVIDIRNAVKRRVNLNKTKSEEEGPEL